MLALVIVLALTALIALQMVLSARVRLVEARAGAHLAAQATAPGWTDEELGAAVDAAVKRGAICAPNAEDLPDEIAERAAATVLEDLKLGRLTTDGAEAGDPDE